MTGNTRMPVAESPPGRDAAVVSCWMCGLRLNSDQMVPDGTDACLDIRWYCHDSVACTERWTSARRQAPVAWAAPPQSALVAPVAEAAKPALPAPPPRQ